jgi:hypothetical protein
VGSSTTSSLVAIAVPAFIVGIALALGIIFFTPAIKYVIGGEQNMVILQINQTEEWQGIRVLSRGIPSRVVGCPQEFEFAFPEPTTNPPQQVLSVTTHRCIWNNQTGPLPYRIEDNFGIVLLSKLSKEYEPVYVLSVFPAGSAEANAEPTPKQ